MQTATVVKIYFRSHDIVTRDALLRISEIISFCIAEWFASIKNSCVSLSVIGSNRIVDELSMAAVSAAPPQSTFVYRAPSLPCKKVGRLFKGGFLKNGGA